MKSVVQGCALLVLTAIALAYARSDVPKRSGRLYFLAATSTWNRTDAFPANLYEIENGKLKLVKEVVPSSEGVNFIRRYDGVLAIGSPHITPTTMYLVDGRSGDLNLSSMPLVYPDNLGLTAELILESARGELSLALQFTSGNTTGSVTHRSNVMMFSSPLRPSDLIKNAPWSLWTDLRITGSTGGPEEQGVTASCTIRDHEIGYRSPVGLIRLAPTPLVPRSGNEDYCTVAAANGRFLVYIRLFRTIGEGFAAKEETFEVYDRVKQRTSQVVVQGGFSRVTLDGNWLVITRAEPNFDHRVNPGTDQLSERDATAVSPSGQELFAHNQPPQYFPGICSLRNLETGAVYTLNTGQADTEILGVLENEIIYRINNRLLAAYLRAGGIVDSKVIAEDENVVAIHWMLASK